MIISPIVSVFIFVPNSVKINGEPTAGDQYEYNEGRGMSIFPGDMTGNTGQTASYQVIITSAEAASFSSYVVSSTGEPDKIAEMAAWPAKSIDPDGSATGTVYCHNYFYS